MQPSTNTLFMFAVRNGRSLTIDAHVERDGRLDLDKNAVLPPIWRAASERSGFQLAPAP